MAQKSGKDNPWLHVEMDFRDVSIPSRGDYAKLRYWDLIEPKPGTSDRGGRTNGFWRLTNKGRAFVNGEIAVPAESTCSITELWAGRRRRQRSSSAGQEV